MAVVSFRHNDSDQPTFAQPGDTVANDVENRRVTLSAQDDGQPDRQRRRIAWWERVTLGHYTGVIYKGLRSVIRENDLISLEPCLSSGYCSEVFDRQWLREQRLRARKRGFESVTAEPAMRTPCATTTTSAPPNTVWAALLRSFWPFLLRAVALNIFLTSARLLLPCILGELIDFVSSSEPSSTGYLLCLAFFCTNLLICLGLEHQMFGNVRGALQTRAALLMALYQKTLMLAPDSIRKYPLGEQLNLASVDVENVFGFFQRWHLLWAWTLHLAGSLGLVWIQLGPACLAGLAVMCTTMPLSGLVGAQISKFQAKQLKEKGQRLSLITEILNSIKLIKLYAWEPAFERRVHTIRMREITYIRCFLFHQALLSLAWNCTPFLISAVSFGCFVLLSEDNLLTPKRVFVSLSLFTSMRFSLSYLPTVFATFTRCRLSLRRIQDFLQVSELDLDEVTHGVAEDEAVRFDSACLTWDSAVVLDDLKITIKEGELVAIIGPVGAGKSSLLAAVLGSMKKLSGHVHRRQVSVGYVPQEAWIQNDTIRRNILLTSPYEANWYQQVLDKCCLLPDLRLLKDSDSTRIGEKGVTLSGGQKQRLCLARAVYQRARLYLLDDPLSAVDPQVGNHLFRDVIGPQGILCGTTRLLVTHSPSVLSDVDRIVIVKDGRLDFVGTYDQLMAVDIPFVSTLAKVSDSQLMRDSSSSGATSPLALNTSAQLDDELSLEESYLTARSVGIQKDEEIVVGTVSWKLYWVLVKRFGVLFAFLSLLGYVSFELCKIAAVFWLRSWSDEASNLVRQSNASAPLMFTDDTDAIPNWSEANLTSESIEKGFLKHLSGNGTTGNMWSFNFTANNRSMYRINVYLGIGVFEALSTVIACFFLAIGCVASSSGLHSDVVKAILRSPLTFFDVTPLGRIVNRLSKDVDTLDLELFTSADGCIACLTALCGSLAVIAFQAPILYSVILPCAACYIVLLKIYLRNSRQLQRLASANRSPVLSYFSETISGSSLIRAFQVERNFLREFSTRLDTSQNSILHINASATWVTMRSHVLCDLVMFALCVLVVHHRDMIDGGLAGLLITYSLITIEEMGWMFRFCSWLEMTVIAAERLHDYTKIQSEKPWNIAGVVDSSWPTKGSIKLKNLTASYGRGQNAVLRRVNLEVGAGSRLGVVGRTGAGKSSLALVLFRIIEADEEGQVWLDLVDVSRVGLHDLRSRLTMIPQDPVLFRGSLRFNIDPQGQYSDKEIYAALEKAHLKKNSLCLDTEIADGGANMSVGERQLVSLARALLRRSRVLVMDEATASVDLHTDRLIQESVRREFAGSTIVTIAHRLNTVLDYDRVIVLSAGEIVEQGSPKALLESRNSVFYTMAKDAGIV